MTVDEYLARLSPAERKQYQRIRKIVHGLVPDVEETISYEIPTFKHRGRYVLYFAAAKNHLSVYPTAGVVESAKGTKGTYRFTVDDPVPEDVVKKIVQARLAVIDRK